MKIPCFMQENISFSLAVGERSFLLAPLPLHCSSEKGNSPSLVKTRYSFVTRYSFLTRFPTLFSKSPVNLRHIKDTPRTGYTDLSKTRICMGCSLTIVSLHSLVASLYSSLSGVLANRSLRSRVVGATK